MTALTISLLALYLFYSALNLMANAESYGWDRPFFELMKVFLSGFFCTPFAVYLLFKMLVKPGAVSREMQDPNFEKSAWAFSIIVNCIIVLCLM